MTVATAGILGHYSKTMLLFFIPQVLNFLYSFPQLMLVIPCPRHRMPGFELERNRLKMSTCSFNKHELGRVGRATFEVIARCRLAHVQEDAEGSVLMSNLTIINFVLYVCGPMHEARLTSTLLLVQVAASCCAFAVRYPLASLLYENVDS